MSANTQKPEFLITQVSKEDQYKSKEAILTANGTNSTNSPVTETRGKKFSNWWKKTKNQVKVCCWCGTSTQRDTSDTPPTDGKGGVNIQIEKPIAPPKTPPPADIAPNSDHLLPPLMPEDKNKKTLVLDLDETLLHSSFKPIVNADFVIPVEIEDQVHQVYVLKRPGVDNFLEQTGKIFELVVFTASLSKYADPVLDLLDIHKVIRSRLFREHCCNHKGNYVKDLSKLGRDLSKTIIIDNSAASYLFHPHNAIAVTTWFDDMNDSELLDLIPLLTDLDKCDDVVSCLASHQRNSYSQHK